MGHGPCQGNVNSAFPRFLSPRSPASRREGGTDVFRCHWWLPPGHCVEKTTAEERGKGHTSYHLTYGTRFSERTKLGLTVEPWPQPTFGLWWTHLCASQETVYLSGFWEERRQSILDVGKDWSQIRSYKEETEGNEGKRKPEPRDKKGPPLRDIVFFPNLKDFFPRDIWSGFLDSRHCVLNTSKSLEASLPWNFPEPFLSFKPTLFQFQAQGNPSTLGPNK